MDDLLYEDSKFTHFSLDTIFTDNHITLLKFVSYGHFPEPPHQIFIY
ncbi:hypothetical protein [Crassaminicella thermophila]|nr:hypothetical protein [Crassaminicella thermophila]